MVLGLKLQEHIKSFAHLDFSLIRQNLKQSSRSMRVHVRIFVDQLQAPCKRLARESSAATVFQGEEQIFNLKTQVLSQRHDQDHVTRMSSWTNRAGADTLFARVQQLQRARPELYLQPPRLDQRERKDGFAYVCLGGIAMSRGEAAGRGRCSRWDSE